MLVKRKINCVRMYVCVSVNVRGEEKGKRGGGMRTKKSFHESIASLINNRTTGIQNTRWGVSQNQKGSEEERGDGEGRRMRMRMRGIIYQISMY